MTTRQLLTNHRWLVLLAAVIIQAPLGSIYSWSMNTLLLTLSNDNGGDYGFSMTQALLPMGIGLLTFAVVMLRSGYLLEKFGARRMTLAGGFTLGIGYILAGFYGSTWIAQSVFIGLIGGAGIGMAYVIPIDIAKKWYPDREGYASGVAVAGFGGGAFIWILMGTNWFGGLLNSVSLFGLPSVQSVFLIYGIAFIILISIGSIFMIEPLYSRKDKKVLEKFFMTPAQMRQTRQYRLLITVFFFSAMPGLMIIGIIKVFGRDILPEVDPSVNIDNITSNAGAWLAVFNSVGRITWGLIKDRIGWRKSLIYMTASQSAIILMTYHGFMQLGGAYGFVLYACLIGFNFGGNFALMPAATSDLFGKKYFAKNYPWVFLPYGPAGVLGVFLPGLIAYKLSSAGIIAWMVVFILSGFSCFISSVSAARIRRINREGSK